MAEESPISGNLKLVRERMKSAYDRAPVEIKALCPSPRLVAVSKTKPTESIVEAYNSGQRHFGENYIQELVEKASHPLILEICKDIQWHFIGHIQTNKIPKLLSVEPLFLIESVDSKKVASAINNGLASKHPEGIIPKMGVMVQVNISDEESKSGVKPPECKDLVEFILNDCERLKFVGLMSIGSIEQGSDPLENDFQALFKLRERICENLHLPKDEVELSMGMSGDFEEAIQFGSTNVRVGSIIFGERQRKQN